MLSGWWTAATRHYFFWLQQHSKATRLCLDSSPLSVIHGQYIYTERNPSKAQDVLKITARLSSFIYCSHCIPALRSLMKWWMCWSTVKSSASNLNIFWPKFQSILSVLQPLFQSNWKWLPYRTKLPLLHSSTRKHTIYPHMYNFYTRIATKRSLWMHSHSPGRSALSVTSLSFLLRSPLRSNVLNLLTVPHTYLKTEGAFQGGPSTLSVP